MKKIPSLFQRDYLVTRLVVDKVVPGCEWVLDGEGTATRKWDGTCCMVREGRLYKRYDLPMQEQYRKLFKVGKLERIRDHMYIDPPADWEMAQDSPDGNSGHWPGWLPVHDGPEDKWHRVAFLFTSVRSDGTYELIGPKVQGNPEQLSSHVLVKHGVVKLLDAPRTYDEIRDYLATNDIEGIVWWHEDGRMCKIKGKDYGLKRGSSI